MPSVGGWEIGPEQSVCFGEEKEAVAVVGV